MVLATGCSRKKNTWTRRAYHNTTARYNAYFNGREITKAALRNLEDSYEDDYSRILPLFIYGDEESSQAMYPDMDEVIKKASKVIERHSIYVNKKEHIRWIDDSYMLIGKARFYKQEYFGALEIFEYVERAFREEPVRVEAMIWMARIYMELDNDVKATLTLEKIDEIKKIPEEYKGEFNALYAEYFIRKQKYEEAIPRLEESIVHTRKRRIRRRYIYVLAQLYHKQENYEKATQYYTHVIKLKPDYIMDFNARINRARAYDVNAKSSEGIKKELNKMLHDQKNEEFFDQIYFALAELAFREHEDSLGIEYLKKSASSSMGNVKQKSLAYLKLGHIYFDRPDYVKAQAYYDSTSGILEKSHPDYELVIERNEGLTKLVNHINTVQTEDSLQKMATMDEKDREKIIRKIIRKIEEEEERKRQEMESSFFTTYETDNERGGDGAQSKGKWYFYNQTAKSVGVTEFFSVWGSRQLADDWRRSNKQTKFIADVGESGAATDTSGDNGLTNKDVEFYLKQLPMTDSAMKVSHNKIIESLFQIGVIYKEDFEDPGKSNESFEKLIERYDTSSYVLPAYYHLYRNYLLLADQPKANYYKGLILEEYPYSEYARLIENPAYARQRRDLKEKVEAYYTATYQLYDYRQYQEVISSCLNADTIFGENFLKPKFDLLKALAIGKTGDKQAFIEALQEVTINHPTHEVKDKAEEMLKRLKQGTASAPGDAGENKPAAIYRKELEGDHLFVLIIPGVARDINDIKIKISNFNSSSFGTSKLNMDAVVLDKENQMISVKKFKSRQEAMNYYNAFQVNKEKLGDINNEDFSKFVISSNNFTIFYKDKNVENYRQFFETNYL